MLRGRTGPQRSGPPLSGRSGTGSRVRTGQGRPDSRASSQASRSVALPTWARPRPHRDPPCSHPRSPAREAPHVAHLADDGLLLLTQVFLTAVPELPIQVLMHLQDLRGTGPRVRGQAVHGVKDPEPLGPTVGPWRDPTGRSSSLTLATLHKGSHTPTSPLGAKLRTGHLGARRTGWGRTTLGQVHSLQPRAPSSDERTQGQHPLAHMG